jgi:hypothetical protein
MNNIKLVADEIFKTLFLFTLPTSFSGLVREPELVVATLPKESRFIFLYLQASATETLRQRKFFVVCSLTALLLMLTLVPLLFLFTGNNKNISPKVHSIQSAGYGFCIPGNTTSLLQLLHKVHIPGAVYEIQPHSR